MTSPISRAAAAEPANPAGSAAAQPIAVRTSIALAIASGYLYYLAFPGVGAWPLAFVCWVPLLVAVRGQTPKRALLLGWMMGLTSTLCGFFWLVGMLKTFSGFNTALCVFFVFALSSYQAGSFAAIAWLHGRAERRGWPPGLVFALSIAASEQAFPLLLPWYAGAQVHAVPRLMQLADVGGPIAVSVALAGSSVALAELQWAHREARPFDRRRVALALAGPIVLFLYGSLRLATVDAAIAAAPTSRIAIIQGNMPLGSTDRGDGNGASVHRGLQHAIELATSAGEKIDLAVWPEGAVNYALPDDDLPRAMQRFVLSGYSNEAIYKLQTPVLTGVMIMHGRDDKQRARVFNSAILASSGDAIGGAAKVFGTYDKNYRLMFGEFLPFGDAFPVLYEISPNSGHIYAGDTVESIAFGEHKITPLICYEDILPGFTNRAVAHGDPDLLVNFSNDAWFLKSTEPGIHLALAKFRAVEHHRAMVRATNSGVSAFIDAAGRSTGETALYERTTSVGQVAWLRMRTIYEVVGNAPWWLATVVVLAMGIVDKKRVFR